MAISTSMSDQLVQAKTPVARAAELHTVLKSDKDIMRMRKIEKIELVPGKITQLKPGGYHIMIIDLFSPLKTATTIDLTLIFEKAGEITIQVPVRGPAGSMSH